MKDNTRSFAVKGYYLSICLSTAITNLSIPIEMQREDEVKEDLQVLRVLHDWLWQDNLYLLWQDVQCLCHVSVDDDGDDDQMRQDEGEEESLGEIEKYLAF